MLIRILTIGNKMPKWVVDGTNDYRKRFPPTYRIEWLEIPAEKRMAKSDTTQIIDKEGEKLLALTKPHHYVIALAIHGKSWSTEMLSTYLQQWQMQGKTIDFLIGGPDGLSSACLKRADAQWSLSALTFPHPLVRIILIEQLYRAWSLLQHHPYHR